MISQMQQNRFKNISCIFIPIDYNLSWIISFPERQWPQPVKKSFYYNFFSIMLIICIYFVSIKIILQAMSLTFQIDPSVAMEDAEAMFYPLLPCLSLGRAKARAAHWP